MAQATPLSVSTLLDGAALRGFLVRIPLLCAFVMLTEGMDTFGVGFIGPFLSKQYGISAAQLATVYTGTVVASLIGAVIVAPLSDRIGRRPLLIATSLIMGPATILTALANSLAVLFCLRFLIGLAFGAALPVAIALVADYAPRHRKAFLLMMMNTGINFGMVLAGLGAAVIIPALGWQALLYVSGGLSLLCTLFAILWLPESLQTLARREPEGERGRQIARRIDPTLAHTAPICLTPDPQVAVSGNPLELLNEGRAVMTALLWFLMSLCYILINFIAYWLPTVMMNGGATISQTGVIIAAGKIGGVCCTLLIGWLADRRGLPVILSLCFAGTAMATALLAVSSAIPVLAIAMLLFACFLMNPNVSGTQALTVASYPTMLRGTATGWISGLARLIGGGAGTLIGGHMVGAGWGADRIAPLLAAVLFTASVTVLAVRRRATTARPAPATGPSVQTQPTS